jgi:hypothetical protein
MISSKRVSGRMVFPMTNEAGIWSSSGSGSCGTRLLPMLVSVCVYVCMKDRERVHIPEMYMLIVSTF